MAATLTEFHNLTIARAMAEISFKFNNDPDKHAELERKYNEACDAVTAYVVNARLEEANKS
jgi:hypothetical protein